jgi:hypothetical protein
MSPGNTFRFRLDLLQIQESPFCEQGAVYIVPVPGCWDLPMRDFEKRCGMIWKLYPDVSRHDILTD